jgi:thiosulfate/3-mercaptopyruvate sulfurtransferase
MSVSTLSTSERVAMGKRAQVLVSTDWVAEHANESGVRLVEVDVDTAAYDTGHIEGAAGWNWTTQLCDTRIRDIVSRSSLEQLLGATGISRDTTIVLYGDNSNWFAAWALWQLKMYGHRDVRLMDGGRKKWLEEGRAIALERPTFTPVSYIADAPDLALRAFRPEVEQVLDDPVIALVDVRSPQEYSGEVLAPPGLPETCQRGGHIPGAANIPWARACNEDGTFKSTEELLGLYARMGVTPDKRVITYCRIGERSSHTWFALAKILGYKVKNYDGSWTEYGNTVGVPVVNIAGTVWTGK